MKTNTAKLEWTKTQQQMPEVGQKVVVFLWMDETVSQAWWNGKHFVLAAANEEGIVAIYEVLPVAVSHWQFMPENPTISKSANNHKWDHTLIEAVH
jgi:hypothetical protein